MSGDELAVAAANGDTEAMMDLWKRYQAYISRLSRRLSNENNYADISQETWLRIFANISQYEPRDQFKAWISKICRNCVVNHYRPMRSHEKAFGCDGDDYMVRVADHRSGGLKLEDKEIVELCLNTLDKESEDQSKVVRLYMHGMEFQDISKFLGRPYRTIQSRVQLGLSKMRDELNSKLALTGSQ